MVSRFLGGMTAFLSVAGSLAAQQPAATLAPRAQAPQQNTAGAFPTRKVAMPTTRTNGPIQQVSDAAPAAMPAPAMSVPAAMPAMTYADPAGTCGVETCAPAAECSACDCLCGPPGRFWVSGEWMYWTARGQNVPPLVTGAPNGLPRGVAGVLGQPTTSVLYGGQQLNDEWRNGFRLRAGMWLDECQRFGIEGDFFFLGNSNNTGTFGSADASNTVTRPFFNASRGVNDAQLVSFADAQLVSLPGVLSGFATASSSSDFIGGGVNFIRNLCCDPCGRLDVTLGYRYLNLRDEVTITENLTALAGSNVAPGTRFLIQDRFRTNNDFHGPVLGLNWERRFGHFFLGVRPSIAMGVTNTTVTIDGNTTIITPAPNSTTTTYPGGLLTQNTNIGRYSSSSFSVVPEIGVRLGVQVTDHIRAYASYNFIYWSNVARAGDQIDLRVNTTQIAPPQPFSGPAVPAFNLQRSDFWIQGIGLGLELRY
ncbi:MAG: BBP7 family outer membrane beta-barrel protein [Fimbriiglobus sp.]